VKLVLAPEVAEKNRETDEKEQLNAFRNRPGESWLVVPTSEK
jgi:hypothetical protein